MYLKRLQLKGFKSFADSTDIRLKPGINILVGPNGCGKSNVVDAVRWVLGSGKIRELRAQKQEDIIFNGAEGMKPQNMARVEMTLDNEDGSLPLEYNEVGILRKLFRDGETEFRINQTKVRLKDIGELFNDTGIGRQGYAVIGQGEVETVLTGKPWERRMMIEEAAGMIKYRQEREEILRKLIHSQNDSVRLADLLAELQNQREVLQGKAEKAQQHTALREERRALLEEVLQAEISQRETKLEENRKQAEALEEKIVDWNREIESVKIQEQAIQQQLAQTRQEEQAAYAALEQAESSLRAWKNEAGVLAERLRHCEQNVEQLTQEVEQNREQAERIRPDVQSSRTDYENRRREAAAAREDLQRQQTEYQTLKEKLQTEEAALTEKQRGMAEKQLAMEQLAAKTEEANRLLLSMQEEKKYLLLRLQEQELQVQEEEERTRSFRKLMEEGQAQWQEAADQQKAWDAALADRRRAYEDGKQQVADNEQNSRRLKNQIQILQQMMENFALHSESVRRLLLDAEQGKVQLPGLLGGVSDLIETPQTLALAMETALGGALDQLVMRTAQDASEAIAYLKKTRGGRITFLPLDNLRIQPLPEELKKKILSHRGVVGIASTLITCGEEIRPAVDYLLGRTVIVETLEEGMKVFRSIRQSVRVVSLEGDVINAGGTMSGGSQSGNRTGILARKARQRQLEREAEEARKVWEESIENFAKAEEAWQAFCQEGDDLRRKQQELALRSQSLTENEKQQEAKWQAACEAKAQTDAEYQALEKRIAEQETAKEKLETELTEGQTVMQRLQETASSHQDDFREMQKSCVLLEERLKGWREQLQMKEQEAHTREVYWKQLQDIQHSYQTALEQAEEQLTARQLEWQQTKAQAENLQKQLQTGEKDAGVQKTVLEQWHDELKKIEAQEEKLRQMYQPLQEQVEKGQNGYHERQLQQVRLETELTGWLEKWQQEFGIPWQAAAESEIPDWNILRQKQVRIGILEEKIVQLGEIDPGAVKEYEENGSRCAFLENQLSDLNQAREKLEELLRETERRIDRQFQLFYEELQENFLKTFRQIFEGGQARLQLEEQSEEEEGALNRGVDIIVQMPGKRVQNLALLSGGEKTLTGIAFVFALLNLKNAPFCIMDEIDAPLDEANLMRFLAFVRQMSEKTQFIVISHRQATIASGEVIYGITMAKKGISSAISLDLTQAAMLEQA